MRVIADFHIHSKYSGATSPKMDLEHISEGAIRKGINLIGTGDFTHSKWLANIKASLMDHGNGIFSWNSTDKAIDYWHVNFILTAEVETNWDKHRIHHILLAPNIEVAEYINRMIGEHGKLSEGRPQLIMSPRDLVAMMKAVSRDIMVIPAHIWTPWRSMFGAYSGFNSVEECYGDQSDRIYALETGLSSDPPMNRRVSALDKYTLISNSDAHSPYEYRLGREATIFDMEHLTYNNIINDIKDGKVCTIETYPEYGKYHYTGCRMCGYSVPHSKAVLGFNLFKCPKCKRVLTKGVHERVNELADRLGGSEIPPPYRQFKHLIPLEEVISYTIGTADVRSARIQEVYGKLINTLGSEYFIMLDYEGYPLLRELVGEDLARNIMLVRWEKVKVQPGYDGIYGVIEI